MKIWDAFGHAVTLNFDLLTPKSNQFISTDTGDIAETKNYHVNHGRTHGQTDSGTDGRPENI